MQVKRRLKEIPLIFAAILVVYIGIAGITWQVRNPKANQMTFWTHFVDAIKFKKLDKFQ